MQFLVKAPRGWVLAPLFFKGVGSAFQLIPLWWNRSVSSAASVLLLIPSSVIPPNLATMLYI